MVVIIMMGMVSVVSGGQVEHFERVVSDIVDVCITLLHGRLVCPYLWP